MVQMVTKEQMEEVVLLEKVVQQVQMDLTVTMLKMVEMELQDYQVQQVLMDLMVNQVIQELQD